MGAQQNFVRRVQDLGNTVLLSEEDKKIMKKIKMEKKLKNKERNEGGRRMIICDDSREINKSYTTTRGRVTS